MIFGSDNKNMIKSGNTDFFDNGERQIHSGNAIFSNKNTSIKSGNMLFTEKGSIMKTGNIYHAPDGQYIKSGNTLFGPNGKSYIGVNSDDEALSIINHNNQ